jgi:uncharacterized protein (DUF488 family)
VLPIEGQNSGQGQVEGLLITKEHFEAYVQRHAAAAAACGVDMVAEANEDMLGTYAMMDATGRSV